MLLAFTLSLGVSSQAVSTHPREGGTRGRGRLQSESAGLDSAGPVPPTLCPHGANSSPPGETARKASRWSKLLGEVTTESLQLRNRHTEPDPTLTPAPPRRGHSRVGFPGEGRAAALDAVHWDETWVHPLPPGRVLLEKPAHLGSWGCVPETTLQPLLL